jgi:hypothetical protein
MRGKRSGKCIRVRREVNLSSFHILIRFTHSRDGMGDRSKLPSSQVVLVEFLAPILY